MLKTNSERFILALFGARTLGHGRGIESLLALVSGSFGITILIHPDAAYSSQALRDMVWFGYDDLIGYALILKALLTGYGLIGNIMGWQLQRGARFFGALVGSWLWVWFIVKFTLVGQPFTLGSFFAFWAFWFSIRIMAMSLAGLPISAAPGAQR